MKSKRQATNSQNMQGYLGHFKEFGFHSKIDKYISWDIICFMFINIPSMKMGEGCREKEQEAVSEVQKSDYSGLYSLTIMKMERSEK